MLGAILNDNADALAKLLQADLPFPAAGKPGTVGSAERRQGGGKSSAPSAALTSALSLAVSAYRISQIT